MTSATISTIKESDFPAQPGYDKGMDNESGLFDDVPLELVSEHSNWESEILARKELSQKPIESF